MRRFVSMEERRTFSGLDRHTIVADPLYRDTAGRDFSLQPDSPNRGAWVPKAGVDHVATTGPGSSSRRC